VFVLAVEHPQRVLLEPVAVLIAQAVAIRPEEGDQLLAVRRAAVLVADAVDLQLE
jgi:hypothetical protein